MNTWILVFLLLVVFGGLGIFGLVTLRLQSKHSKRMAMEEGRAHKWEESGVTPISSRASAFRFTPNSLRGVGYVILAVGAIAFLIWGFSELPSPKEIGTPTMTSVNAFAWHYWFWVAFVFGIFAIVLAFTPEKVRKPAYIVMMGMLFFLFIGCGIIGRFVDPPTHATRVRFSGESKYPQTAAPLASEPLASWTRVLVEPGDRSALIPVPVGMRLLMKPSGRHLRLHTIYADGHECMWHDVPCPSGNYVGDYITNAGTEAAWAAYAFAPIRN